MDTGLAVRPTTGATQTNIARPDPAPVREAVATDLAAAQSVTASANANAARHDAQSAQESNVRKIILDAHSREVIFQVVNAESGRVIRQIPDEAMLRLRAYTRAIAQGRTPNEAAQADIEA
jgi:flagellar protein FlaG